jgi:cytidylate kinase
VTENGAAFGPYLLVSRECGSGGGVIARRVGEQLDWNVYDAKIVDEIARDAHVNQRLVQSVDEHVHSHWEREWRSVLLDDLADEKYLRHLKQVVMALGHHGNVVIVGRGAQFFLPLQCALRVRLVAPLETRVNRLVEREKLSSEQARTKIEEIDSRRAAFVWKIFRKDNAAPFNQDLIINTGEISVESATKIILASLEEKFGIHPNRQAVFSNELRGAKNPSAIVNSA